jgi:hypothetical protein
MISRYQKTGTKMQDTLSGTYVADLSLAGNDLPGDTETRHRRADCSQTTEAAATWKAGGRTAVLIQNDLSELNCHSARAVRMH